MLGVFGRSLSIQAALLRPSAVRAAEHVFLPAAGACSANLDSTPLAWQATAVFFELAAVHMHRRSACSVHLQQVTAGQGAAIVELRTAAASASRLAPGSSARALPPGVPSVTGRQSHALRPGPWQSGAVQSAGRCLHTQPEPLLRGHAALHAQQTQQRWRGFASRAAAAQQQRLQKRSAEQGLYLVALVVGMVGLTYASVPLYRCAALVPRCGFSLRGVAVVQAWGACKEQSADGVCM
jgi:hypothetical protein